LALVEKLGIPIPKIYSSINEIDDNLFPIFYKPKFEKGGGVRGVAWSRKELESIRERQDLIFQEYIPGQPTYGMGFVAQDGTILTSFQHEECLSLPIQGGSAVLIKTFYDGRLKAYTDRIIQALGFEGWGLAEYKYCPKRRDFVFMEINAKLWASIEFAFMNNNRFLKYMFGIDYSEEKVDRVIFVDRLISLGSAQLVRNSYYLFNSRIISYQPIPRVLIHLIARCLPLKCRQLLRKIILRGKVFEKTDILVK